MDTITGQRTAVVLLHFIVWFDCVDKLLTLSTLQTKFLAHEHQSFVFWLVFALNSVCKEYNFQACLLLMPIICGVSWMEGVSTV